MKLFEKVESLYFGKIIKQYDDIMVDSFTYKLFLTMKNHEKRLVIKRIYKQGLNKEVTYMDFSVPTLQQLQRVVADAVKDTHGEPFL